MTVLFTTLCRRLFENNPLEATMSLMAGVLFAVHPVHVDAAGSIVGAAELLAAFFSLVAMHAYIRCCQKSRDGVLMRAFCILGALLGITLSTLSKEQGFMVFALLPIYELLLWSNSSTHPAHAVVRLIPMTLGGIALLRLRFEVMDNKMPHFTPYTNPVPSHPVHSHRWVTYLYYNAFHGWLLVWPWKLSPLWNYFAPELRIITTITDPRNLSSMGAFFSMFVIMIYAFSIPGKEIACTTFLCFSLLSFLPSTNLVFNVGFQVAERVLFMPSMGFCAIVSSIVGDFVLLSALFRRSKSAASRTWRMVCKFLLPVAFALLLSTMAAKTHEQAGFWQSAEQLWEATTKSNPFHGIALANVGQWHDRQGDGNTAHDYYQRAVTAMKTLSEKMVDVERAAAYECIAATNVLIGELAPFTIWPSLYSELQRTN